MPRRKKNRTEQKAAAQGHIVGNGDEEPSAIEKLNVSDEKVTPTETVEVKPSKKAVSKRKRTKSTKSSPKEAQDESHSDEKEHNKELDTVVVLNKKIAQETDLASMDEIEKDEKESQSKKEALEVAEEETASIEGCDEDEVKDDIGSPVDDVMDNNEENDEVDTKDLVNVIERVPINHPPKKSDGRYHNKQRCLTLSSRGVTARFRHFLEDLRTLIPHHKKDSKLDPGNDGVSKAIREIASIKSCNTFVFLECRRRLDAYLWMGCAPNGPSAKFHVTNVHTMDELRLTGNCMKGSRPVLTFDESFGRIPHLQLLKNIFIDIFGTPRGHPKSKPFIDRVMGFYYADSKIWVRNYQIVEEQAENAKEAAELKQGGLNTMLVEIGPRFVMAPVLVLDGCLTGRCLYNNDSYVTPNKLRIEERKRYRLTHEDRTKLKQKRKKRNESIKMPKDPLSSVFR